MRLFFSIVILLLSVSAAGQQELRVIKWEKLLGWKHAEVEAYYDSFSIKKDIEDGKDFGYGVFLFNRSQPVTIHVQGKVAKVTSFARYFVVDCENARMAVVADYYFNLTHLPLISDRPLYAIDYSEKVPEPTDISKDDPVFKTVCPRYI